MLRKISISMVLTLMLTIAATIKFATRAVAGWPWCFNFSTCSGTSTNGPTAGGNIPSEIRRIEKLIAHGENTIDNHIYLGWLYSQLKNSSSAEAHYQTALKIATDRQDKQGEARAYAALGELYAITNQRNLAISNFQQSRSILLNLRDTQHANEIQLQIQRLQPQSHGK